MKTVMSNHFAQVPTVKAPRSMFDRSHGHKTAFDAGYLIPIMVDDVLPGDTYICDVTALARMTTPLFPLMDNMVMDIHHFFVPLRLVWDDSRKFFGERENPDDSIDYTVPEFTQFTATEGSLHDYLGLPIGKTMTPHCLYHRAYNRIWNEWYRDQNLQDSVYQNKGTGPDAAGNYTLLRRNKRYDYFTSQLPYPQKGDAVTLPLGAAAPVVGVGATPLVRLHQTGGSDTFIQQVASGTNIEAQTANASGSPVLLQWASDTNLEADLSSATAATINDLREAFQVQRLLERDARSGTRYSEIVASHFGVEFPDVTYRPEYLGGGSTPINVNPIQMTAASSPTAQQQFGDVGAFVTASMRNAGFTKTFSEHGIVMTLVSVRADLTYQQGMPREYMKRTRYDFYWPVLAYLGEQPTYNSEIYYQNTAADDDVFGYQERYAEYRYKPSRITGILRSTAAAPLDAWHLSQEFTSLPVLGSTFIEENPPIDRVVATPTEPHFIFDSFIQLRCARPMPTYSVPGMIDHF